MTEKEIQYLARVERLTYYKAWRASNPEKVKKHNDNYWRKRAESKLQEQNNTDNNGEKDADCDNE